MKTYLGQWQDLRLVDGILYRVWQAPHSPREIIQLVAPQSIQKVIFEQLHCNRTAGHLGTTRTAKQVRSRFFWPNYKDDIERWC